MGSKKRTSEYVECPTPTCNKRRLDIEAYSMTSPYDTPLERIIRIYDPIRSVSVQCSTCGKYIILSHYRVTEHSL